MLFGHVDASPVLVAPPAVVPETTLWQTMFTFFLPFSPDLWGLALVMIVLSGLIDYFLEFGHGGTLPSSIHEYFGGVLWGGFQDPHTRLSAVFQVVNALISAIRPACTAIDRLRRDHTRLDSCSASPPHRRCIHC